MREGERRAEKEERQGERKGGYRKENIQKRYGVGEKKKWEEEEWGLKGNGRQSEGEREREKKTFLLFSEDGCERKRVFSLSSFECRLDKRGDE